MGASRKHKRRLKAALNQQLQKAAAERNHFANDDAAWRTMVAAPYVAQFNPTKRNIYTCEACGWQIVCTDREPGVTPYLIQCQAEVMGGKPCAGTMTSAFYCVPLFLRSEFVWTRPSLATVREFGQAMREYVEKGGLLLEQRADWREARAANAAALELFKAEQVLKLAKAKRAAQNQPGGRKA